jgi:hypothetical protein
MAPNGFKLDEQGTKAAPATAVTEVLTSSKKPFAVRADQPFLYFIVNPHNNAILFFGRFTGRVLSSRVASREGKHTGKRPERGLQRN